MIQDPFRPQESSLDQFKDLDQYLVNHGPGGNHRQKGKTGGHPSLQQEPLRKESVISRWWGDIFWGCVVIIVAFAASFVFLQSDAQQLTPHGHILGQSGYEVYKINAPSLSGFTLNLVSYLMSTSRFAPW